MSLGPTVVCGECDSDALRARLKDITDEWGVPLSDEAVAGSTEVRIVFGSEEEAAERGKEQGEQGYVLEVAGRDSGLRVDIKGGDEAGAFYALESLRQLLVRKQGKCHLRPTVIRSPCRRIRS